MKNIRVPTLSIEKRRQILISLVAVQLLFLFVLFAEFVTYKSLGYSKVPWAIVELFWVMEVIFGFLGIAIGAAMIFLLVRRNSDVEMKLKMASGAFEEIMYMNFAQWNLTTSEKEVALFTIKGMSVAEIVKLRGTSEGTIKAQSSSVYRKAGVNSRAQLLSLFVDELLGESIVNYKPVNVVS